MTLHEDPNPIAPGDLLQAIEKHWPNPKEGEFAIVVEVSTEMLQYIVFGYRQWSGFYFQKGRPINRWLSCMRETTVEAIVSLQDVLADLPLIDGLENLVIGFVVGDKAGVFDVREALSELLGVPVDELPLPVKPACLPRDMGQLKTYIRRQPHRAPHTLTLLPAVYEHSEDGGRFEVAPVVIYEEGDTLQPGRTIREVNLVAPVLNEPIVLYFQEAVAGKVERGLAVMVRATSKNFGVLVYLDPDKQMWRLELEGAVFVMAKDEWGLTPPLVTSEKAYANIALVVETTLGMQRLVQQGIDGERLPPEREATLTDFKVIERYVKAIVDHLATYSYTGLKVLLILYSDTEDIPPECVGLPGARAWQDVVHFIPDYGDGRPEFVDITALQEDVTYRDRFLEQQTVTVDWHKSLEVAMKTVADLEWDHADRVAVWIGQAPPHVFVPEGGIPPIDQPGFTSPVSFEDELRRTREKGIEHFVLFVEPDIPEALKDDALRVWQKIGGRNLKKINAAYLDDKQIDNVAVAVGSFKTYVQKTVLQLKPAGAEMYNRYWALTADPEGFHQNLKCKPATDEGH